MRWLRIVIKLPLVIAATLFFAAIPFLARLAPRRRRDSMIRVGANACRRWGRTVCAILKIERDVRGPVPAEAPFVVVSNHVSYLDILVLGSLYPGLFLAKREISSWPVFGPIARGAGTLFVDRDTGRDVVRAGREIADRLEMGVPVTIFPEGRASCGASILPFQPSLLEPAARSGTPCWAASISYETPGAPLPPARTVCWHDSESLLTHFPRLAGLPRVVAHVRFAPVPVTSTDRKVLASTLWESANASFSPVRQD